MTDPVEQYQRDSIRRAQEAAIKAEERLSAHELICADRYARLAVNHDNINVKMTRMEMIQYALVLLILLGDGTIVDVMKRLIGPG